MLIKATQEITKISDNKAVNSSNYMESLSFINNIYTFINTIKKCISISDIQFAPSFKGEHTCEKFGIAASIEENEMRRFIIKSELLLEDKELRETVKQEMGKLCESIIFDSNTIEFILR